MGSPVKNKQIPPVTSRRPFLDNLFSGYKESNRDFVLNNIEACVWFLENHKTIRKVYHV